jgi:acyl carrier protein
VENVLHQYVATNLLKGQDASSFSDTDSLLDSGILDSIGLLHLMLFVEREFRVSIADEELVPENFETIETLAQFLRSKQDAAPV